MHKDGEEIHVSESEASGGTKTGHMRWVLGIGLLLAIGFMSLIWITGALSQGDEESQITAGATTEANSGNDADSTDSIIGAGEE
ncbi:hypothetical protein GCM10023115_09990 [Pontixanthobacter gangjinensis]|uniref:Uncharacterized protein n=1 Tax=Pontixanthobacter gangjinensis TaxID=1028742 RepID=A0A6I4SKL0_9SPHN|nr:hypothetical protein [Pontixanthobacter gangjinensis]MXO56245.1 hypothetical protein [Pontixanthobacter gangjinensis]